MHPTQGKEAEESSVRGSSRILSVSLMDPLSQIHDRGRELEHLDGQNRRMDS